MTWIEDLRAITDAATPGEWMEDDRAIEGLGRLLRFHSTFDPLTVAAMLDVLEAAELVDHENSPAWAWDNLDAKLARVRETVEADRE